MAKLDHKIYGNGQQLGPTKRFVNYLKTYVAGKSEDKYREYYNKRCEITHDGTLFLSDLDLYGDIQLPSTRARLPLPHNNRTIGADNRESPTIQLLDCHNICPLEGVYLI